MSNNEKEAIFKIAVREAFDEETRLAEAFTMPMDSFPSANLERKMKRLIRKVGLIRMSKLMLRSAAVILAILLLNAVVHLFTGTDLLASGVNYIHKVFENKSTSYVIPDWKTKHEESKSIINIVLEHVPEDFIIKINDCDDISGLKYYESINDRNISFYVDYEKNPQKDNNDFDTEHQKKETYVMPDGTKADLWKCVTKGYYSQIIWSKGHYLYVVGIVDNLEGWEVNELIKIAEGLKPIYKE